MIANPVHYIISINEFSFLRVSFPAGATHDSPVGTQCPSDPLTADSALNISYSTVKVDTHGNRCKIYPTKYHFERKVDVLWVSVGLCGQADLDTAQTYKNRHLMNIF